VTGPTGIVEQMGYDLRGRKTSMTNPDSGSYTYAFNGAGELVRQSDANGTVTVMTYDSLGRAYTRSETGGAGVSSHSAVWAYDSCDNTVSTGAIAQSRGKLCSTTANGGGASAVSAGTTKTILYDEHGRAIRARTQIAGVSYDSHTAFDSQGRTQYVGYPAVGNVFPMWVENSYNNVGFLNKVSDAVTTSTVHWLANSRYNDGASKSVTVGGVAVNKNYDTVGRVKNINATFGATALQTSTFAFDEMGNLVSRADTPAGLNETFTYDKLNRLTTSAGTGGAKSVSYDDAGNILTKSGVAGAYVYFTGTHRVQTANGNTYAYDANGNLKTGAGRTINYTPFNLPDSIATSNVTLAYKYDAERSRTIETVTRASGTDTTVYIGGQFFESVTLANGDKKSIHYIASPDGVIAVMTVAKSAAGAPGNSTISTKYWLKDHLGSIYAEMDVNGGNIIRMSFDAWGKRRLASGADGDPNNLANFSTQRGFTGHEMLDEVGLVHMNGRIYDPVLGRFMQADPIIQSPFDGQNYNRYSYVMNNPLSLTDPTGFSWWTKWRRPIIGIVVAWAVGPAGFFASSGGIVGAAGLATGGTAQFLSVVAGGFAAGGINGGNLNSALQGAFFAAAFYGVGDLSGAHQLGDSMTFGSGAHAAQVAGHMVVGCAQSAAAGGSCRAGALSAGFAAGAGPLLPGARVSVTRFAAQVLVGAAASRAGGGSFENGAITAAFGYLFNEVGSYLDRGYVTKFNAKPPLTVPPSGEAAQALYCVASCMMTATGQENSPILVTGGSEISGHSPNSAHYDNRAVDIASANFNKGLNSNIVYQCAANCDYATGQYESFPSNPSRNHWHLQLGTSRLPVILQHRTTPFPINGLF
jgi:RHS repeat-associated protein